MKTLKHFEGELNLSTVENSLMYSKNVFRYFSRKIKELKIVLWVFRQKLR